MIFVGFLADLKKRKFLLRFSELYHQFYLGRCGSEEGLVLKIGAPVAFKTWRGRQYREGIILPLAEIYIQSAPTIHVKPILLCVWAEPAILGRTKTALKFKYEI